MSDLTLKIRASFDQAQKAFEELAESSAETREQMERFAKTLEGNEVDEFNRKQKMLQNSLIGTRGETAALEASVRNYTREIEKNIRNGMNPNSDAIRALRAEQEQLQKRIDASRKAQERKTKAMKAAKTALKATAVAAAGLVTGIIALTRRNANLANDLANSARIVGLTTEAYQELDYAMRMSGIENGDYMLNRMARSVIDVRNETGTLTKFLEDNYYELLRQLQGVENNEEAFTLLMDAIHRAPNEFMAAELAMAAFGRNGAQMVLVAQNGAEGINALREEARELGVVSHANAQAAMAFNDALFRLRTAAQNMTQELTVKLLPALTNIIVRVTNAIQRAGEFRARLEGLRGVVHTLVPIIAGATAGLTAFFGTMKAIGYITVLINKIRTMTIVFQKATAATVAKAAAKKLLAYVKSMGKAGAIAGAAAAGIMTAAFFITRNEINKAINSAMEFTEIIKDFDFPEISFVAEEIAELDMTLSALAWGGAAAATSALNEVGEKTLQNLRRRLGYVEHYGKQEKNSQIAIIQSFLLERAKLESDDMDKRIAEIRRLNDYLISSTRLTAEEREAVERAANNAILQLTNKSFEERLNAMRKTENQIKNEQINIVQSFLAQRLNLESEDWDERYAFLKEKLQIIKETESFTADERHLIEQELNRKLEALNQERVDAAKQAAINMMRAYSTLFGGLSKLFGVFRREQRAMFMISRSIAIVQAGINTALAVTKTLSQFGATPVGIAKAIGVGLKGAAQKAKIISSMVSAETGGRFVVPQSSGVDNSLMRVNPGETVEVTPRGMTGNNGIAQYVFKISEQVIFDIVNKGGRSGDIYEFEPARNL